MAEQRVQHEQKQATSDPTSTEPPIPEQKPEPPVPSPGQKHEGGENRGQQRNSNADNNYGAPDDGIY